MAGRPVTIHGSQTGTLAGIVALAGVSILLLAVSILMFTRVNKAELSARDARVQLEKAGTPPSMYREEADRRKAPYWSVATDDIRRIASGVTGAPDDTSQAILAKLDQTTSTLAARHAGIVNKGSTALTVMMALSDELQKAQSTVEANTVVISDLQSEKENLTTQNKSARDEFEGQVAKLGESLTKVQDEKAKSLEAKDSQLKDTQSTLEAVQQQLEKLKREGAQENRNLEIKIRQYENQIAVLQKQIANLKQSSFDKNKILTSADGKIIRAVPGSDVVYINLGAADHIKPGMGFEIFSRTAEPTGSLRGKASIEVGNIMEDTAECRVTRREPAQPIVEGDIIVNLAYDRSRKPKFVVRGDFDLNYDGVIDYNGAEQIASLIRQWGGQVVDDLDETVDFVVIGQSPKAPVLDEKASDVVRAQAAAKEQEGGKFAQLRDQAAKMYIPVVTQNQFLFLTGFAGDVQGRK